MLEIKAIQAKVLANFGKELLIDVDNQSLNCINDKKTPCVAGDNILFTQEKNQHAVCYKRLERDNVLINGEKEVAANIDYLNLVVATSPHYQYDLINRYLIVANKLHIKIRILVTKLDLCQDIEKVKKDFEIYQELGYEVLFLSQKNEDKVKDLSNLFKDKINLFVGQSGVGKSTLINLLIPDLALATQTLSKTNLGKHTTTWTKLYLLQEGGYLVDSPGIREFNLDNLSPEDIKTGFIEFFEFSNYCKFRNCSHTNEPNCGVIEAIETHKIHSKRYQSYLNLL
jgi:ribosome biogenesis GTPase